MAGCETVDRQADRQVAALIKARQQAALQYQKPLDIERPEDAPLPGQRAYADVPNATTLDVPEPFETPSSQPAATTQMSPTTPTTRPSYARGNLTAPTAGPGRARVFTLTDALAYAQQHRRQYQSAKEDLYLVALALTLERHLWTPIFAAELRTVYGNYGEAQSFDQAMRFVADLGVSQRLPYGGEFTAAMISTLIRDVGRSITAEEGSEAVLGVDIPLLRGAGHVAREGLIQLERDLTYAVRVFERFRRSQLVTVAQAYFDLLRVKQRVIDSEQSLARAQVDVERAKDMENVRSGDPLDTLRALQRMYSAESTLAGARESFQRQADNFKLTIGMPVEEPLGRDDLEDIESIEQQILDGKYPLLRRPMAASRPEYAAAVALERRLDLLTAEDQVEDARRGVAIARNAMLPELNWNSTLTFDTQDDHYGVGSFHVERANWRSELILELPVERTAERNALRRSMISVRAAQRNLLDSSERVRAEVRDALRQLELQEINLRIQRQNLHVAERRAEYAQIQFEEGNISNRDKVEAETELLDAQNALNQAKTSRWVALLNFRLTTETLLIDEDGGQMTDPLSAE